MENEPRLYELIEKSIQGDTDSCVSIINRFSGLIRKESYNVNMVAVDDDLMSEIYMMLYKKIPGFKIRINRAKDFVDNHKSQ